MADDSDRRRADEVQERWKRYGIPALMVAAALFIEVIEPYADIRVPYLLFFVVAAVSGWAAGFAPGAVAAAISTVAITFFVVPPTSSLEILTAKDVVRVAVFAAETLLGAALGAMLRTSQQRAARALRGSEERFRTILHNAPAVVFLKDEDGRYLLINREFEDLFGLRTEDVIGKTDLELFPAEVAVPLRAHDARVRASGRPQEFEEMVPVGDEVRTYISVKFTLPDHGGGKGVICGIATDITDRKRAEETLKDSDRRKDEFLAMLAHELRNPLAPIRHSVATLIRRGGSEDAPPPPELRVIDRQVEHLARLLDDLLNVAWITRGRIELRPESLTLAELVDLALETAGPGLERRREDVSVELPEETVRLWGDKVRLTQVLSNLLSNAAKYSPPGTPIELRGALADNMLVIRVRDQGVGMTPEVLGRIFDRFFQVESSLDRTRGGLGLGLSLVKGLVELHGGTVSASSAGLDQGSELVVSLPASLPGETGAEPRGGHQHGAGDGPSGRRPRRILVVDDNRDTVETFAELLRLEGNEVETALSGPTALSVYRDFRPEIVFLDIGLPGMDGWEVARKLRLSPGGREVLLVAVSGYGQPESRQRSRDAGFDRHLLKPVDLEEVRELVASG